MISFTVNLYLLFSAFFVVEGTLTPDGTGPLDCGSQRSFTCSVTGGATWNITGLSGISIPALPTGLAIANNNGRITTTDTMGVTQSSTITITGFTTSDDGGTIRCIDLNDGSVQGVASISVGTPSCPIVTAAARSIDFTNATVSWQQPPNTPVTSTTVTYCPTSSPNCGNSVTCTSPCTISGLDPCMDYSFTVIPNNNCGSATGCTANSKNVTSQGLPSCLTSFSANRDDDFTSATVTYQLDNPPPGTSTTVTYCPTSSPNCGRSMNCPSTGPCTISGLNICVNYSLSAIPNNNCGNATGCNENSMVVLAKAAPSCPRDVKTDRVGRSVTVTWTQDTTPPGTVTEVTFSPSSNGRNSSNCPSMSSCIIDELDPSTKYQFTVFAENNCVRPTRCTGNTATSLPSTGLQIWVIIIIVIVVVIILIAIIVAVVFIVICCCCAVASAWLIATCCCCCKQANKNRNKPERFNQPPDEYVDPKKVREKKEKEEKITYAALEFSEQAGSTGEKPIRSKEEPVQYLAVEQA